MVPRRSNHHTRWSSPAVTTKHVMTLSLTNIHPVNLNCTITSSSLLEIYHGASALSSYGSSLFDELPSSGTHEQAEVVIADFTHNGNTHEVHVWEADDAGGLTKWTRQSGASCSGAYRTYGGTNGRDVLIVAVPPGVSVPEPTSTNGPPAPGTTQSTVKVKITKQGGMPF